MDKYIGIILLLYHHNTIKNQYEIGEIVNKTTPTSESLILDIGCGTGHHVAELSAQNLNVVGIDISPSMIAKAKENYPQYDFKQADVLKGNIFEPSSFTHIMCLYFTIYYLTQVYSVFNLTIFEI